MRSPSELPPLVWATPAFGVPEGQDRDGDCMDDEAEFALASHHAPVFALDSRENARRPTEPAVAFQVTTGRRRPDCASPPAVVRVIYAYLFEEDGGYAASAACGDRHPGDNQSLRLAFDVRDGGTTFQLRALVSSPFTLPGFALQVRDGAHPVLYLSAGKHHAYFDTRFDGRPSPVSRYGCVDGVDGEGPHLQPALHQGAVRYDVGEREAHPSPWYLDDLTSLGFPGERAWDDRPFCGGRGPCGGTTGSMASIWR